MFLQQIYQEVKNLKFLTSLEELAMKYYLDKYCLTLLLQSNKLCQANGMMAKLKKELCINQ